MKTSLKLFLASIVLLTQGFAQEPKQALAKQVSSGANKTETAVSGGAPLPAAPVVLPAKLFRMERMPCRFRNCRRCSEN